MIKLVAKPIGAAEISSLYLLTVCTVTVAEKYDDQS